MNRDAKTVLYREVQRWNTVWWVMVIVLGIAAVQWWGFIQQVILGQPFGNNPATNGLLFVFWLAFGIGLPLLFYLLRMVVEVYPDRIIIDYRPFAVRTIATNTILNVEPRFYDPLREFGGWGLRGLGQNRAYNVSGNTGVQLILRDRSRVLIGTQKPDRLAAAILTARYGA